MLKRYGRCVYRYLLGATRNPDSADELSQEFAFRFIRGDLKHAHPTKGRFRDYLRVALRNLVNDYFRRRAIDAKVNTYGKTIEFKDYPFEMLESQFKESWRREVIQLTWNALESLEQQKQNYYFTVLRFRAENSQLNSTQIAAKLSLELDSEITPEWVRQKLHRARQKFGALLIDEVRKTVSDANPERLNEELAELKLLEYLPTCQQS